MFVHPVYNKNYMQYKINPKSNDKSFKGYSSFAIKASNVETIEDCLFRLKEPKNLYDGVCDILNHLKEKKDLRIKVTDRLSEVLNLAQNTNYKERKVHGIVGHGANGVFLELDNKQVLSMSYSNPFYGRGRSFFDLPVLDEGYSGRFYYSLRPLVETENLTFDDVAKIRTTIQKAGYKTQDLEDYKTYQICEYKGKKYLLDAQCAYR